MSKITENAKKSPKMPIRKWPLEVGAPRLLVVYILQVGGQANGVQIKDETYGIGFPSCRW